jgi:uncharacterized protein YuzE
MEGMSVIRPISVKVDAQIDDEPVAYLRYSSESRTSGYSVDPDGAVNVDLDEHGHVVGIELLAVDDHTLMLAREVANAHDLWLPATIGELLHA